MSTDRGKRIENLQQKYEDALDASRDDPRDGRKHQATIDAAEKLATARQDDRVDQVKRGVRAEGIGVTAEQNPEG